MKPQYTSLRLTKQAHILLTKEAKRLGITIIRLIDKLAGVKNKQQSEV